jgi:hypothetical protein
MKILVYGDASPGSGGWCYSETLRDMGHEVVQISDYDLLEHYQQSILFRAFRKINGGLRESDRLRHVACLHDAVTKFRPEIVIILKGLHLSSMDVLELRKIGAWVCNINHDDFFSLNRNNWSHLQREAIPACDFIFTTREVNVEEIRPLNRNVDFFPFAYYPRIHRPVPVPVEEQSLWGVDVVFVGTYEAPRAATLEYLVAHVNAKLVIHGAQWDKLPQRSRLRACVQSKDLRFDTFAKALGGAKIALGFLRKENRDDYTQRTFEIPACGGVLLAERTARHQALFQEGVEAEFFDADSPAELCQKVQMLLEDKQKRESIHKAGQAAVLRGKHTYQDRLEKLFQVFARCSRQK